MSSVPGGTAPPCPGSTAGWGSRNSPAAHAVLGRGWGPAPCCSASFHHEQNIASEHATLAVTPRSCSDEADSTAGPLRKMLRRGDYSKHIPQEPRGRTGLGPQPEAFMGPGTAVQGLPGNTGTCRLGSITCQPRLHPTRPGDSLAPGSPCLAGRHTGRGPRFLEELRFPTGQGNNLKPSSNAARSLKGKCNKTYDCLENRQQDQQD